jgi:hypothetical protein
MFRSFLVALLLASTCPAQYRRGRQQDPYGGPVDSMAADFQGTVRGVTSKDLVMETADGNTMEFRITRKTVIRRGNAEAKASAIEVGMKVNVAAKKAPDNSLDAVRIELPAAASK